MRTTISAFSLAVILALTGCGGAPTTKAVTAQGPPTQPGGGTTQNNNIPPVDPSGNWVMRATDASGHTLNLAAVFSQAYGIVLGNSITAPGNPDYQCAPFSATLADGAVSSGTNFTGTINAPFGPLKFTTTLNPSGTTLTGTYSGVSGCAGIAASGSIVGTQIPSMTGSWQGTITCGSCVTSSVSFTLTQHNDTGKVTGIYSVTNEPPYLAGGSVGTYPPGDILSGTAVHITLLNITSYQNYGDSWTMTGTLGMDKTFTGTIADGGKSFQISMRH